MKGEPQQRDLDDLSAWLDGELEGERAQQVKHAVASDANLRQAHRELRKLDELLDAFTAPAPPDELAGRIIANLRFAARRPRFAGVLRWAAPIAAAAALIVTVGLYMYLRQSHPTPPNVPGVAVKLPEKADSTQGYAKVSFFGDFEVLENFDTIEAIEQLESRSQ